MIARSWDGTVPADRGDDYFEYLSRTGVRDLESTPGNLGVFVMRRIDGDLARFRMISVWESASDIRAFAGNPIERARYYPEDEDFLLELVPEVEHFEVLHGPEILNGPGARAVAS
jgi:heme-degrading monooxygenase HmoA